MQEKKNLMTRESVKKYEDELEKLKFEKRAEIAKKIQEAREQGDLSENAEYDAAMDEQRDIEARIEQIENILKHVEVVDEDSISTDKVSIGGVVKILDVELNQESEYKIGSPSEANPIEGVISYESPVGAAILNKTIGETVTVEAPVGPLQFKILDIKRKKDEE